MKRSKPQQNSSLSSNGMEPYHAQTTRDTSSRFYKSKETTKARAPTKSTAPNATPPSGGEFRTMMRFIEIRDLYVGAPHLDEDDYAFSIWNTVTDRYMEVDGEQMWYCWDEFAEDWKDDPEFVERIRPLCRSWVFRHRSGHTGEEWTYES